MAWGVEETLRRCRAGALRAGDAHRVDVTPLRHALCHSQRQRMPTPGQRGSPTCRLARAPHSTDTSSRHGRLEPRDRARGRAHHRLRLLRAARHRRLRRLCRQLPARARARRRRRHRRRRGTGHAHARARRPRPDVALQHAGRLSRRGPATRPPGGRWLAPVKRHLLVTNDFPPKVGGIQNYLWDLWRRLDPSSFVVLTASLRRRGRRLRRRAGRAGRPHRAGARHASCSSRRPTRWPPCAPRVEEHEIDLVLLDPALPLGLLGPHLDVPYGVVLHGAEVTVPGRLPGSRAALGPGAARRRARRVGRGLPGGGGPPRRAGPRGARGRGPARRRRRAPSSRSRRPSAGRRGPGWGCPPTGPLVVSVSRLVPRKGMDVLIDAADRLAPSFPDLVVAIAGDGRELGHLRAPGRAEPGHGATCSAGSATRTGPPSSARPTSSSWPAATGGSGLEQEGFGIVFLEAAAAGVPQVAGDSGGASEAVVDGETGLVVADPGDPGAVAEALRSLLADPDAPAQDGTGRPISGAGILRQRRSRF